MSEIEIPAPEPNEYDEYFAAYIGRVSSPAVLVSLRDQRTKLLNLLTGLSEEEAGFRYQQGKWSMKEVLGHLIDTERVFAFRAMSIARGEAQELPGFDQDEYVSEASFDSRSMESLILEYAAVRDATLALFEGLDRSVWLRLGTANGARISVRALAYIVAGHEVHHLEVLEDRYLPGD